MNAMLVKIQLSKNQANKLRKSKTLNVRFATIKSPSLCSPEVLITKSGSG